MVIAPHPDDESLGAAGLIQRALSERWELRVLLMTSGDGFRADAARIFHRQHVLGNDMRLLGLMRMKETLRALGSLGVHPQQVRFLGLPDGGTAAMLKDHWRYPFTSYYTQVNHVPYARAVKPGMPYTGSAALGLVRQELEQFRPDTLVLPHPADQHPDHWAAHAYAEMAIELLRQQGADYALSIDQPTYLVHWPDWPLPFGVHLDLPLLPPRALVDRGTTWMRMPLTVGQARRKLHAIEDYSSQILMMSARLTALARSNELFGYYPSQVVPTVPHAPEPARLPRMVLDAPLPVPGAHRLQRMFARPNLVTQIGAALYDGDLYLGFELGATLAANEHFTLYLRFLDQAAAEQVRTLNITVAGERLSVTGDAAIPAQGVTRLAATERSTSLRIPGAVLQGAPSVMVGVQGYDQGQLLGGSMWRLLRLKLPERLVRPGAF